MGNTTPYVEVAVTPLFRSAADAASRMFGGLDILSVDFLQLANGTYVILEVNDTATGLNSLHYEEDVADIVATTLHGFEAHMNSAATSTRRSAILQLADELRLNEEVNILYFSCVLCAIQAIYMLNCYSIIFFPQRRGGEETQLSGTSASAARPALPFLTSLEEAEKKEKK